MNPKIPGTSGTIPVKGTGCGIRPDLDELGKDTGFDFSRAKELLQNTTNNPDNRDAIKNTHEPDK